MMKYRRYRREKAARHADDWLVTYADMITLLLCFFIVFLAATVTKLTSQPASVQVAVKEITMAQEKRPEPAPPPIQQATERQITPPDSAESEPTIDQTEMAITEKEEIPPTESKEASIPAETPQPQDRPTTSLPEIAEHLKKDGSANFEQKGDRLTTLEMNSAAFFEIGSATLSEDGKKILRDVIGNLQSDAFRDYQVTVEGHTDDTPIKTTQFPSNWELSTARAAAVVRYFIEQGVPTARLRAAGYADTFPKKPNRDQNGTAIPSNQAQNRRVVIKLEKLDKAAQPTG